MRAPAAPGISYSTLDAPGSPPEGLYELLCTAFAEPPYEDVPAKMRKRLDAWADLAAAPGFRVVLAHRAKALVGACFGWDSAVGSADPPALFAGLYRLLGERPDSGRLTGTEVVELAVDPAARGLGVAAGLLARLLDDGPGWLLADATAPAHGWYARRGWVGLGPVRDGSPYVLMVSPGQAATSDRTAAQPYRPPSPEVTLR